MLKKKLLVENSSEHLKKYPILVLKLFDGYNIHLRANIELLEDINDAEVNNAAGIGLYRTEYLYISRSELPSEEVQFENYSAVARSAKGKPVIIRTLDLGGDKLLLNDIIF